MGGGKIRPLLFDSSPLLPSAVFVNNTGRLVVGRDAEHSARLDPARYEPHPKRRIDDLDVLLGERAVPVTELVAAALTRVRDEAVRTLGGTPATVTMTCPVTWGTARRQVLVDAAAMAGLPQPALVAAGFAVLVLLLAYLEAEVGNGYSFIGGTLLAAGMLWRGWRLRHPGPRGADWLAVGAAAAGAGLLVVDTILRFVG
ncbi:hypothetical protein OHA72_35060 [Dactylosporangium sp. NBC_01737]|uniref:hypothetical protein n=1 Tax=Dactylosporangium sp. NBC_01737 TaxID=2975959 RepID=UPI002E0FC46F|nr:hypothetical protein OHA72_35060 [Dactylosporangium sp. NBC_01737]